MQSAIERYAQKIERGVIEIGKLIDADDFYQNLAKDAVTEEDRKFCNRVKHALIKQE